VGPESQRLRGMDRGHGDRQTSKPQHNIDSSRPAPPGMHELLTKFVTARTQIPFS